MWATTRSGFEVLDEASCENWRYVNWERRRPPSSSGDEAPRGLCSGDEDINCEAWMILGLS